MRQEDFDEYIRQVEPSAQQSAADWQTAIGLQQVDGLKPSQYLLDMAQRNIEGDISIDEVRQLLDSYYSSKTNRTSDDDDTAECDKAAANIKKILSTDTFAFNTNGFISTHRRIFEGVLKHAGELRTFDITKKEWVLRGDTVNYQNWEDLRRALDYDIRQERDFSYKGLSEEEKISHICRFVSGLWQIHPFREGNTRTTAVFTIQYLRSMRYSVTNDLFKAHSWYFRNALVRANYKNVPQGIDYSPIFLERFFRNLLLGENHPLLNREMHLDWKGIPNTGQSAIQSANVIENPLSKCKNCTLEEAAVLLLVQKNPSITQKQIAAQIGKSERTVKTITVNLVEKGIIIRRNGKRNGYWEIIKE